MVRIKMASNNPETVKHYRILFLRCGGKMDNVFVNKMYFQAMFKK